MTPADKADGHAVSWSMSVAESGEGMIAHAISEGLSNLAENLPGSDLDVAEAIDGHARTIAEALGNVFVSPNESDSNGEVANVVDGLYFIGRAIYALAKAVEKAGQS